MRSKEIEKLASIKSFAQLVAYLRDEMGWPIAKDSFEEVDDLFFDYSADELGIDPKTAVKIEEIKRLRPLSPQQPWGIFFVKFAPKRLPVVALRRILGQVALKKRASANKSERTAWSADDLLFVSNYGSGDERQISFAHFSSPPNGDDLPTLKVLGWDDRDTALHLDAVAKELTEHLAWPQNEADAEAWRSQWRSAFTVGHREAITTSRKLAQELAALARRIRDRIQAALALETAKGPLTKLMTAFQQALVHDLNSDSFSDMYAQTIAYGLLSARIADPSKKTADDFASHMRTSPFLRELMGTFLRAGGRRGKAGGPGIDFDELGVSDVVELLDDANMEAVVCDFGDRNPLEDPVIHFYEHFLSAYNKQLKIQRGVFYTPQPVVSYIVRSVHELLQTEFGLADGLADTTTWGEMLKKHPGLKLPPLTDEPGEKRTIAPDEPFVQILDPATGTATFLVEVIGVIHRTLTAKWKQQRLSDAQQQAAWNDYVPKHLLPRLHAFELLMAPYAIAHMKIGLKLTETGYRFTTEERARIYLTNALEPWAKQLPLIGFDALAHEAAAVNEIKRHKQFTVVLGNPPYSVLSANLSDNLRRIVEPYRYVDGKLIEERSMLRLEMHLQDDYVKFMALMQKVTGFARTGIIGVITNNGYLDNLTLRGVRCSLLSQFHSVRILNLHGSRQRKQKSAHVADENVFDIEQGVAIALTTSIADHHHKQITYAEIIGSREQKYTALLRSTSTDGDAAELTPTSPNYFLVPRDDSAWPEYSKFPSLTEVMPVNISGIVTAHDFLVVDFEDQRLIENARILRDKSITDTNARSRLGIKDNAGWKLTNARAELQKTSGDPTFLKAYGYRPFDVRRIYYHPALVWCDRRKVMSHVLAGGNMALATCRQLAREPWDHIFVTRYLQDDCLVSNRTRERSYHFPLLLKGNSQGSQRQRDLQLRQEVNAANFADDFREKLVRQFEGAEPSSEDIFHYIYAVLHSPTYRSRYSAFLKIDFPRLPLTGSLPLFHALARLGGELVALHLLESPRLNQPITEFIGGRNPEVEKVSWSRDTVWLDKGQTTGFRGVREPVWTFHIGGYQVCEKWLKDRKGRKLTKDDLSHYQKIVVAISDTIRLMKEIDEVIEQHGGWPDAFAGSRAD